MAKSYYAVLPDGTVYRCPSAKVAGGIEDAIIATDTNMVDLPTALLVKLHNLARPERPVTRFADRNTALKRVEGVLDLLARPVPGAPAAPEAAKKKERAPKEPKEPKVPGKRGAKPKEIPPHVVERVVELREAGKGWTEILAELGEPNNFIHRIRAILKAQSPSLVRPLGPGSPNYGKGPMPREKRLPREKKAPRKARDRGVPVELF